MYYSQSGRIITDRMTLKKSLVNNIFIVQSYIVIIIIVNDHKKIIGLL